MILLSVLGNQLNILLGVSGLILLFGLLLKRIKQPYIIAYIITGIILGPHGFKLITEYETAEMIGELGLIMLMFFIGMEISIKNFISQWKVALFGTGLQIAFSIFLVYMIGLYFGWAITRVILLGFIISLSSSAVVIKLLQDYNLKTSSIGQNIISILLTQDVLIAPMLIIMTLLSGKAIEGNQLLLQIIGGVFITTLLVFLLKKETISLPFHKQLKSDKELQVFGGLIVCFSLAFLTSILGLSASLGAFVGGVFVHSSPSTKWLHNSLHSFRIILVSIFFISIGMLINLNFLVENWKIISLLVVGVFVSNHGINAFSLKFLGNTWKESFYGAAFLAQIGEFSFVLASLGYYNQIISSFTYQITVIVVSITIFLSPLWTLVTKRLVGN